MVEAYNASVADGYFEPIDVVHGYGKSGVGGTMHSAVRSFLSRQGAAFHRGEDFDRNPGHTVIYPEKTLPSVTERLQVDILAYCETPKTKEQIAGKYRRSGAPAVEAAIKSLVGAKMLRLDADGRVKRYVAE
jgi:hypothetical protein